MSLPGVGQLMMRMQPSDLEGARKGLAMAAGEHAAQTIEPERLAAANASRSIPGAMRTLIATVLTLRGANAEIAFTESDLARVHAPMLLVWGKSDVFGAPSTAEHARALHPEISVELVEGG